MNSKVIDPVETHQVAEFKHQNPLTTLRVDPTGRFGAMMEVEMVNDGPVTLILDSRGAF